MVFPFDFQMSCSRTGWVLVAACLGTVPSMGSESSDWNQWRGPNRNGVLPSSPALLPAWEAQEGPVSLWESERVPSNDDGGHGSVVVVGDRAYLSVVWHQDVPTETRAIDELVLRDLGYRSLSSLGKDLVREMEEARLGLSPRLRGSKLDQWAEEWVDQRLNAKQKENLGSYIVGRFKKGKAALSIEVLEKLNKNRMERFPNQAAMEAWLTKQGWDQEVLATIVKAVPATRKVAQDVILCLDLDTGRTVWKASLEGEPTGRNSSSTPAVSQGKVVAVGSTHLFCVDAANGKPLWQTPLAQAGPATSPLIHEGRVFISPGYLQAYRLEDGGLIWEQKDLKGSNASPALWMAGDLPVLVVNARAELAAVDAATCEILWKVRGGGDSTPAIQGNHVAVYSRQADLGLAAYTLDLSGPKLLWKVPLDARRTQSSPIVYEGHVYLAGGDYHLCVELESGRIAWKEKRRSNISSPILADGKLFAMHNNGNEIIMLKADPTSYQELDRGRVRAMWCPSPTISQGRLILRHENSIRCYDLTGRSAAPAK